MTSTNNVRQLLLIGNSILHDRGYLDYAESEIREFAA